jgi:hypothetical protein
MSFGRESRRPLKAATVARADAIFARASRRPLIGAAVVRAGVIFPYW